MCCQWTEEKTLKLKVATMLHNRFFVIISSNVTKIKILLMIRVTIEFVSYAYLVSIRIFSFCTCTSLLPKFIIVI